MICGICGKELEENSVFCIYCGARQVPEIPAESHQSVEASTEEKAFKEEKPKKKKTGCIIAVIIAVAALILVIAIPVLLVLGVLGIGLFAINKEAEVEPNFRNEAIVDDDREDDIFYGDADDREEEYNEPVWEETEPYDAVAEKYTAYVFSNSDSRYLNYAQIDRLTAEERQIAELEIRARHGETFDDPDVQAYFNSRSWYSPGSGSSSFNAYEEANLELFDVYRRKENGTLYQGHNVYINAFPSHPEYAISYSDSRYLTDSDLRNMSENQLCVARNEILARHGRIFKDPYLREYFLSQPWYKPTQATVNFGSMSSIEQSNYSMIEKYEDEAEIAEGAVWSAANPYKVVYDEHGAVAYLFPDSDSTYLSRRSLTGMTEEELTIARSEILARRGYIFSEYYLNEYFVHRNWYTATTSSMNALGLNQYEKANIALIDEILAEMP